MEKSEGNAKTHTKVCAVGVDLGACHTGLASFIYEPGQDLTDGPIDAAVIKVPVDALSWWDQSNRRVHRHQRRGQKRRKLARRLLWLLITGLLGGRTDQLEKRDIEFINGLLKRRGFTFMSAVEDSDHAFESIDPSIIAELVPEHFNASSDLNQQIAYLSADSHRLETVLGAAIFQLNKRELKARLRTVIEDNTLLDETVSQILMVGSVLKEFDKALRTGHRHRCEYFREISVDLADSDQGRDVASKLGVHAATLARVVGHLSNLQLRALRWYFNDPNMEGSRDYWDSKRFDRVFRRWVRRWQTRGDQSIADRRQRLLNYPYMADRLLLELEPDETIPPFENQNNRRPPICQALLLSPSKLTSVWPQWRLGVGNLRRKLNLELGADLTLDEVGDGRFLHRVLDRTTALDPYKLRLLVRTDSSGHSPSHDALAARNRLAADLGSQHMDSFLRVAELYYADASAARRGVWSIESSAPLLDVCGKHPPLKKRQKGDLLRAILGAVEFEESDVDSFASWLASEKLKGNRRLRGVLLACADAQKIHGNGLKEALSIARRRNATSTEDKDDKALLKLEDEVIATANRIGEHLGLEPERVARFRNIFSLAQIGNLLYVDIHGFGRSCTACAKDNGWRSSTDATGAANAQRLPADSIRPFDGHIRGAMSTVATHAARWHASRIREQVCAGSHIHVPIVLEQNAFRFAADKATIKRQTNERRDIEARGEKQQAAWQERIDRIRDAAGGLCAYTGQTLGQGGELDHILPRSETRNDRGTVINSEANLIYVSSEGNQKKEDNQYELDNLALAYLNRQFGSPDPMQARRWIVERASRLFDSAARFTSFRELTAEDQKALRHALFIPELIPQALQLMAGRISARVNGTQAYWARLFIKELRRELSLHAITVDSVAVMKLPSGEQSYLLRAQLAEANEVYRKSDLQAAGSHVIDAALAVAAMASRLEGGENPLRTWVPEASLEDTKWLQRLLPSSLMIHNVERKPTFEVNRPWTRPLFKASQYAERFVPLWARPDGSIAVGFDSLELTAVKFDAKADQTTVNDWLDTLLPWLHAPGTVSPKTAVALFAESRRIDRPLPLRPRRERIFELLHKVAHERCSDPEWQIAKFLDGLRYCTLNRAVTGEMLDAQGKPVVKAKLDERRRQKLKLGSVKVSTGISHTASLPSMTLCPPLNREWEKFLSHSQVIDAVGNKKKIMSLQPKTIWSDLFNLNKRTRGHQRVRQTFSLPVLDNPSGGYRVRRKKNDGSWIWQVLAVDSAGYEGFPVDADGAVDFRQAVPFRHIGESPNLTSIKLRRCDDTRSNREICSFSKWLDIDKDRLPTDVIALRAKPNSESRFMLQATMSLAKFATLLAFATTEEEPLDPNILSPYQMSPEVKPVDASEWRQVTDLPTPRGNLALVFIDTDRVSFRYRVMSTPTWLKQAYSAAHKANHARRPR